MNNKINTKLKWFPVLLGIAILVGLISAVIPEGIVYAESSPTPVSTPSPSGIGVSNFFKLVLERTYKFQTRMIDLFSTQFNKAEGFETKAQQRIADLKQQGKDVSSLEKMLAKFYDLIANAKQAKDKASAILNLHQGFDAQGKVIDLQLAQETSKSVEMTLRSLRENIIQAFKIIANGLKEYKNQNNIQSANMVE